MCICPKCGSPTNCKQHYTYYWVTDIDTGIPYMERQPYGMYHECRKCSWTDRFAEDIHEVPDNESDGLLTMDIIRDAMKKTGVDLDEQET